MNIASGSEGLHTPQDVDALDAGMEKPAREEPLITGMRKARPVGTTLERNSHRYRMAERES